MTPRTAALQRPLALRLAEEEYRRVLDQLRRLSDEAWKEPTDCPAWDVRQLACHLLGMIEMTASLREMVRQQRAASRAGGDPLDALTALQVAERADWPPGRVVARLAERYPRAVVGRRRVPGVIRARRLPQPQRVGADEEWWTVGFLLDVILTRDPWMHRLDIARATGTPLHLTPDHDGVLVADLVQEWAARHGRSVHLVLEGPAGGTWTFGSDGPQIRLDAVEFCRVLSGRPSTYDASVVLDTAVPF